DRTSSPSSRNSFAASSRIFPYCNRRPSRQRYARLVRELLVLVQSRASGVSGVSSGALSCAAAFIPAAPPASRRRHRAPGIERLQRLHYQRPHQRHVPSTYARPAVGTIVLSRSEGETG